MEYGVFLMVRAPSVLIWQKSDFNANNLVKRVKN